MLLPHFICDFAAQILPRHAYMNELYSIYDYLPSKIMKYAKTWLLKLAKSCIFLIDAMNDR